MCSWCQTNFSKNSLSMFFPQTRRFWVTLHCRQNRDDVTIRDRRVFLMVDPPVKECLIWYDIEALFGGRSLSKHIRYIRTKYEQTFSRRNGVKDSGPSLIDTVSIDFVEYPCLTGARRTVTRAASLIPTLKSFYRICPHCMEHCSLRDDFK
jgi:hypothetical protein